MEEVTPCSRKQLKQATSAWSLLRTTIGQRNSCSPYSAHEEAAVGTGTQVAESAEPAEDAVPYGNRTWRSDITWKSPLHSTGNLRKKQPGPKNNIGVELSGSELESSDFLTQTSQDVASDPGSKEPFLCLSLQVATLQAWQDKDVWVGPFGRSEKFLHCQSPFPIGRAVLFTAGRPQNTPDWTILATCEGPRGEVHVLRPFKVNKGIGAPEAAQAADGADYSPVANASGPSVDDAGDLSGVLKLESIWNETWTGVSCKRIRRLRPGAAILVFADCTIAFVATSGDVSSSDRGIDSNDSYKFIRSTSPEIFEEVPGATATVTKNRLKNVVRYGSPATALLEGPPLRVVTVGVAGGFDVTAGKENRLYLVVVQTVVAINEATLSPTANHLRINVVPALPEMPPDRFLKPLLYEEDSSAEKLLTFYRPPQCTAENVMATSLTHIYPGSVTGPRPSAGPVTKGGSEPDTRTPFVLVSFCCGTIVILTAASASPRSGETKSCATLWLPTILIPGALVHSLRLSAAAGCSSAALSSQVPCSSETCNAIWSFKFLPRLVYALAHNEEELQLLFLTPRRHALIVLMLSKLAKARRHAVTSLDGESEKTAAMVTRVLPYRRRPHHPQQEPHNHNICFSNDGPAEREMDHGADKKSRTIHENPDTPQSTCLFTGDADQHVGLRLYVRNLCQLTDCTPYMALAQSDISIQAFQALWSDAADEPLKYLAPAIQPKSPPVFLTIAQAGFTTSTAHFAVCDVPTAAGRKALEAENQLIWLNTKLFPINYRFAALAAVTSPSFVLRAFLDFEPTASESLRSQLVQIRCCAKMAQNALHYVQQNAIYTDPTLLARTAELHALLDIYTGLYERLHGANLTGAPMSTGAEAVKPANSKPLCSESRTLMPITIDMPRYFSWSAFRRKDRGALLRFLTVLAATGRMDLCRLVVTAVNRCFDEASMQEVAFALLIETQLFSPLNDVLWIFEMLTAETLIRHQNAILDKIIQFSSGAPKMAFDLMVHALIVVRSSLLNQDVPIDSKFYSGKGPTSDIPFEEGFSQKGIATEDDTEQSEAWYATILQRIEALLLQKHRGISEAAATDNRRFQLLLMLLIRRTLEYLLCRQVDSTREVAALVTLRQFFFLPRSTCISILLMAHRNRYINEISATGRETPIYSVNIEALQTCLQQIKVAVAAISKNLEESSLGLENDFFEGYRGLAVLLLQANGIRIEENGFHSVTFDEAAAECFRVLSLDLSFDFSLESRKPLSFITQFLRRMQLNCPSDKNESFNVCQMHHDICYFPSWGHLLYGTPSALAVLIAFAGGYALNRMLGQDEAGLVCFQNDEILRAVIHSVPCQTLPLVLCHHLFALWNDSRNANCTTRDPSVARANRIADEFSTLFTVNSSAELAADERLNQHELLLLADNTSSVTLKECLDFCNNTGGVTSESNSPTRDCNVTASQFMHLRTFASIIIRCLVLLPSGYVPWDKAADFILSLTVEISEKYIERICIEMLTLISELPDFNEAALNAFVVRWRASAEIFAEITNGAFFRRLARCLIKIVFRVLKRSAMRPESNRLSSRLYCYQLSYRYLQLFPFQDKFLLDFLRQIGLCQKATSSAKIATDPTITIYQTLWRLQLTVQCAEALEALSQRCNRILLSAGFNTYSPDHSLSRATSAQDFAPTIEGNGEGSVITSASSITRGVFDSPGLVGHRHIHLQEARLKREFAETSLLLNSDISPVRAREGSSIENCSLFFKDRFEESWHFPKNASKGDKQIWEKVAPSKGCCASFQHIWVLLDSLSESLVENFIEVSRMPLDDTEVCVRKQEKEPVIEYSFIGKDTYGALTSAEKILIDLLTCCVDRYPWLALEKYWITEIGILCEDLCTVLHLKKATEQLSPPSITVSEGTVVLSTAEQLHQKLQDMVFPPWTQTLMGPGEVGALPYLGRISSTCFEALLILRLCSMVRLGLLERATSFLCSIEYALNDIARDDMLKRGTAGSTLLPTDNSDATAQAFLVPKANNNFFGTLQFQLSLEQIRKTLLFLVSHLVESDCTEALGLLGRLLRLQPRNAILIQTLAREQGSASLWKKDIITYSTWALMRRLAQSFVCDTLTAASIAELSKVLQSPKSGQEALTIAENSVAVIAASSTTLSNEHFHLRAWAQSRSHSRYITIKQGWSDFKNRLLMQRTLPSTVATQAARKTFSVLSDAAATFLHQQHGGRTVLDLTVGLRRDREIGIGSGDTNHSLLSAAPRPKDLDLYSHEVNTAAVTESLFFDAETTDANAETKKASGQKNSGEGHEALSNEVQHDENVDIEQSSEQTANDYPWEALEEIDDFDGCGWDDKLQLDLDESNLEDDPPLNLPPRELNETREDCELQTTLPVSKPSEHFEMNEIEEAKAPIDASSTINTEPVVNLWEILPSLSDLSSMMEAEPIAEDQTVSSLPAKKTGSPLTPSVHDEHDSLFDEVDALLRDIDDEWKI